MKKKSLSAGKIIMVALILTFTLSNFVYGSVKQNGTDIKFTKHAIDSNSMTKVATGTKINSGKTLYIEVTHMYDADGKNKDCYKYSRWQVYKSKDSFSDVTKVKRGQYTGLKMDSKVYSYTEITAKAKGNNNSLDAQISGYLYNFTKK